MSDDDELDLDGGDSVGLDSSPKKSSGLGSLLPNILKFVAIGLGALIFIVTVAVITFNILNRGGRSQTVVSETDPYVGRRPQYSMFTAVGVVRTRTNDPTPYSVVVNMVLGYDMNDKNAQTELTNRLYELRDFTRSFFNSKSAADLQPENEARLKQEIMEALNTRILEKAKIRMVVFTQLDIMEM
ncbi:flagellar basal body-associated FliL family protein [Breznakiella homolactica]|uniref:Flagellar protein FliL n=1 Tax=Breznakiella homolactica TaxID=2798577 RepID=A0A7T7XKT2_9SPIR|nr:flagellar basal body-associated FliL family protein [Breznakiella homolactica]QQO08250.1 flagellar basal body-associated FliL family protein [Breznakiella homolactica]